MTPHEIRNTLYQSIFYAGISLREVKMSLIVSLCTSTPRIIIPMHADEDISLSSPSRPEYDARTYSCPIPFVPPGQGMD